ncbi:hypothetical protein [Natronospira bacteriovora]|uniref:Uncharacterized protein n=1 Tax=Natronospira bacteriovora TaxID=3069753 RepID=A0ABU0W9F2_9GAMM|nr:hypothetical protein [Natronospira sp. AB-CW4]MDQ2070662.1 hypothetical protein [Natronospira sp. AB-CW4]
MSGHEQDSDLLTVNDLESWFRGSVREALSRNDIQAEQQTGNYLAGVLLQYARSDSLYEITEEGRNLKPLAFLYRDAMESPSEGLRRQQLQRLGDVALFIAGYFAESLSRKAVDVDYYAGMGGAAYNSLAASPPRSFEQLEVNEVFRELAEKFTAFMDVLAEVGRMAHGNSEQNILRLYETWMRTGSPRARRKLEAMGITPDDNAVSRRSH